MASPSKLPGPALTIKSEPGTSKSPSLRLPSFKPPRDMMLGGPLPNIDVRPSRKVYIPNLNVQRKKNQEETAVKADPGSGRGSPHIRGGRGRGERGRKKLPDLEQSASSVFSEGIAKDLRQKRESKYGEGGGGGGGGGRGGGGRFVKTSARIDEINHFSTEEDSYGKLAHILKDCDFIDDPGICPDEENQPKELLSLPLTEDPSFTDRSAVKSGEDVVVNGVKVKQEDSEMLTDAAKTKIEDLVTFPKLFRASSPKLILMKLPPGLVTPDSAPNDVSRPSTSVATPEATVEKSPNEGCNLPEGRVGTMQLMKSGEVRFLIGDHMFIAEIGAQSSMKQDVMVVNVEPSGAGGDSINLGPVDAHFVTSRVTLDSPYFNPRSAGGGGARGVET